MKPAQVPAAREVVMRRTDDVQVVIEPRAIGLEVAALVYGDVSAETIRRMQDEEGFPCVRYGTRRLVPVAEADAWLAARAERDTRGRGGGMSAVDTPVRPAPQPSRLIPAEVSAIANELAAEDDSPFARAFRAEMERVS